MKVKTFPGELIGETIIVVESNNPALKGISGKVIDETQSTIKIESEGKIKTLLKNIITFKITGKGMAIEGRTIIKRPEDRLKG